MGKTSKKKRSRDRRRGGKSGGKPNNNNNDEALVGHDDGEGSSTVTKRIRHGDPRIRHGALSALSSTLFAPSSLVAASAAAAADDGATSSKKKKKQVAVDEELVRAVAERMLDDDVPCALTATGCISNYVSFGGAPTTTPDGVGGSSSSDGTARRMSSFLGPILIQRLNRCDEAIGRLATTATTNEEKKKKGSSAASDRAKAALSEQWDLVSTSLSALCGLVESCTPDDLEALCQLGGGPSSPDLLTTLLRWSSLGRDAVGHTQTASSSSSSLSSQQQQQQQQRERIAEAIQDSAGEAALYALRTLHAALDDNAVLLSSFVRLESSSSLSSGRGGGDDDSSSSSSAIAFLDDAALDGNLPTTARLHAAGALVTARNGLLLLLLPSADDETTEKAVAAVLDRLESTIVRTALPLLRQHLAYHPTIASALVKRIVDTKAALDDEKNDEALERDVVRTVNRRREPARAIARRQKLEKEERQKSKAAQKTTGGAEEDDVGMDEEDGAKEENTAADVAMMVSEEEESKEEQKQAGGGTTEDDDAQSEHDRAVSAWNKSCLPLKLALEITANLCSGASDGDVDGNAMPQCDMGGDDDDEAMWDSDDEAKLQSEAAAGGDDAMDNGPTVALHPRDVALFDAVVQSNVPDSVLALMGTVGAPLPLPASDGDMAATTALPSVVDQDLCEIQSKCGACLGNAACNLRSWRSSNPEETASIWSTLIDVARRRRHCSGKDDKQMPIVVDAGTAGACHAMVALLRSRPSARSAVGESDLDTIIELLSVSWIGDSPGGGGGGGGGIDAPASEEQTTISRDAAAMLGVLCSEPHPDAVNARVCDALLSVLRSPTYPAAVSSEIFNVLMDMYGDDDDGEGGEGAGRARVFREKDVLGHFQRCLPLFKQRIRRAGNAGDASPEDLDMWRETVLNASRFIKYKQGCL